MGQFEVELEERHLAHDRAVQLFRSGRVALKTQYAILALMILYTVTGLWLLWQG